MAGLEAGGYRLVGFPEQKDFMQQLLASLDGEARSWVAREAFGADAGMLQWFQQARKARTASGIQARMPFDLQVY